MTTATRTNGEAEKGLLRSLFALPEAIDDPHVAAVKPADFADSDFRTIYEHLVNGWRDGVSPEAMPARLTAAGQYSESVRAAVIDLMKAGVTGLDAAYHATELRQESERRQLRQLQIELGQQIDHGLPPEDVRGFLASYLDSTSASIARKPVALDKLVADYPDLRGSVLNGLLREAEIGNFVSMSKVGKSWLGYSLGLCVQAGVPWLNRFSTRRGKVLLIDNELDVRTVAFRVPKVADALGIDDRSGFDVESLRGQLVDIFQLRPFFRQFKPGEYKLVILDALFRFWPKGMSENDNAAVTAVMNQVAAYAERMGAAFALVHHSSKGAQGNKNVVDVGAGAAALARAADTHLVLREHETEGAVVLEVRTRSWEQPQPMVLRWEFPIWTPADDLDPAALKTSSGTAGSNGKPNRLIVIIDKCRELLASPMTKNALRKSTGGNATEVNAALDTMTEEGEVEACEVITTGGRFPGYRLKVGKVGKVGNSTPFQGRVERLPKGKSFPTHPSHGKGSVPTRESAFDDWGQE